MIAATSKEEETNFLKSEATIFINYRRDDSKNEAAYLRDMLAGELGPEKVFRDIDSIKLGANFPEVINNTIANASVVIVLIGNKWLTVQTKTGQSRLKAKGDYVRLEIETALKLGKQIIPVLLNGALPPEKSQLPASIAQLATINAVELSWFKGFTKMIGTIAEVEKKIEAERKKEREKRSGFNLEFGSISTRQNRDSPGKSVIVHAMEFSLRRSGKRILLDEKDFFDTLDHYQDSALKGTGGFFFNDMIYIVDFIGIKAKTGNKRYSARSMPLKEISEVPGQLVLKRPVICGFTVFEDWFDKKVSKTGMIDYNTPKGAQQGSTVGVIISWNPESEQIKLLTPWPGWGKKGVATITKEAMFHIDVSNLRAIEAVEMLSPQSQPLLTLSRNLGVVKKRQAAKKKK